MAQLPRPATVDVTAAEEDCGAWEDVLDVDDSDLRISPTSSSRPLHPTTAPHRDNPARPAHDQRIPGPASAFQDSVRLRESGVSPVLGRADSQDADADADFLLHPWLCALHFLGKDRAWERPGIKRIMVDQELDRAPLVVGVVTSCKPNELGDLFLTLKDPTGMIGASVHRKVLSQGNVGHDIAVGCVIVLTKIAVFRPSHTVCYLNISQGKVVKVLRKDCGPAIKQEVSSEVKREETQLFAHLGGEPLGTSEGAPSIFRKMVSRTKHSQVADLHSEAGTENVVHGTILGLDRSKICKNKNPDSWEQRQGGNLTMFERGEAEGSANINMGWLGREKMVPSRKDITLAAHKSSNNTSAHKSSSSTDGPPQKSFNTRNTCSQPIPGTSSAIPGDRACTQDSNNEKLRLSYADEIMLPNRKKLKTNAVHPDCYDAAMNTSIDAKCMHGSGNNMDIDVHDMAEPFHGGHSSTCKPDGHQQNDFHAANTGTAQSTKETSVTGVVANSESLLLHPRRAISVAPVTGWTDCTDEQLSELFADY